MTNLTCKMCSDCKHCDCQKCKCCCCRFCQSCGMPKKMDKDGGGKNIDGTVNEEYCSLCYQNGEFTSPEIKTAKEMQKLVMEKMVENKTPRIMAWFLTRNIPKLKRWKK